jgi:cytoskeletal protein CcmA (bactofilin family)
MGLFGKPDAKPTTETPAPASASSSQTSAPSKPLVKGTVMGEKTRYNGKLDTDEPLLIQGHVDGEIKSSSEVEVGETGVVKATITAKSIVISGRVNGDCTATERLEIRASGKLNGGIKASRISIADGAEFKGSSQMGAPGKA